MGRGRLLKTKVKEAKKIARAEAFGKAKGEIAAWKSKPLEMRLMELLENASKTINPVDAFVNAGLAIAGYQVMKDWKGLLIGPIGLKLAQSQSIVASTSGVVTLALLGLASTSQVQDIISALLDPDQVMVGGKIYPQDKIQRPHFSDKFPYELMCNEGYELKRGPSAAFCVPVAGTGEIAITDETSDVS